jgi:flagellar M-ring protein FliF
VPVVSFLKGLVAGLMGLGMRRLVALGLAGITVFALVAVSGYYLSRPEREVLYSGLDPQDVTRIGSALEEAGIAFDVSVTGDAVLVDYGKTARARMLLAEKGLPKSDGAGYELFDKMGSLGLTSFMQQVTRVRALEGELARTIQLIDGVKAARVHLALRSEGTFRNAKETPTASVIVRSDGPGTLPAAAIRHLVAAAIPGLGPDQVTVMSTDGTLLSSSDDSITAAPEKLIGLERTISSDIEQKIQRTLGPYLGADNFRVSVTAKLNADRKQISETNFDPNSRVERSVRSFKESGEAQNANGQQAVSVDQNIPQEATPAAGSDTSKEKKDRKEELTNYEINSKTVSTVSEGYGVDALSVALVINKPVVMKTLGDSATQEQLAAQLKEIEQLAASAAGLVEGRGDKIKVTAVDFTITDQALEPVPGEGIMGLLGGNLGTMINAGALILVSLLILLLGLRPALKAILAVPGALLAPDGAGTLPIPDGPGELPGMGGGPFAVADFDIPTPDPRLDDLAREIANTPQTRLEKIVELDTDRAAQVLKAWLAGAEASAA